MPELTSFLEAEMAKNQKWKIKTLKELSRKTGLSIKQLYKWNWDRTNRYSNKKPESELFKIEAE